MQKHDESEEFRTFALVEQKGMHKGYVWNLEVMTFNEANKRNLLLENMKWQRASAQQMLHVPEMGYDLPLS